MYKKRNKRDVSEKQLRTPSPGIPTALFVIAFIFVAGLGYVAGSYGDKLASSFAQLLGVPSYSSTLDLSSLQETYRILQENYDGEINQSDLIEGAQRGLVEGLGDQYTVYLNTEESQAFNDGLSGSIGGGVGIQLSTRNELVSIVRVLENNPAAKAGLKVGDSIIGVNDEDATSWTVEQAVAKIRGEVGTTVALSILRDGETQEYTITRAEVNNPSVYSTIENGVGILTITRFDTQTGSLARQAARTFSDNAVQSVILDLRGNGGGYLTAAQDVAGIWLDNKVVVTERARGAVIDELYSSSRPILDGVPTIVLVDGATASASEILAGALQDYNAAQLLGEVTFGKGSVQQLLSLPGGAQLKVTIARWFTPEGKNISEKGISPAVIVERSPDDINEGRDPQLDRALQLLRSQ